MTTASIATSLVACFIQLICLMSRPMRTMLRMTKYKKRMNRLKHRKENNKCETFLLVWEFCGEPGEVWEFKKNVRFSNWCWNSYASGFAGMYIAYCQLCNFCGSCIWIRILYCNIPIQMQFPWHGHHMTSQPRGAEAGRKHTASHLATGTGCCRAIHWVTAKPLIEFHGIAGQMLYGIVCNLMNILKFEDPGNYWQVLASKCWLQKSLWHLHIESPPPAAGLPQATTRPSFLRAANALPVAQRRWTPLASKKK